MWCRRRMEKISWNYRVRNEVLQRVDDKRRRKANGIGHIVLRNCLVKHIIEGKIEGRMTGRRGIRRKQLPYDLK
jgi:hypothetical protein